MIVAIVLIEKIMILCVKMAGNMFGSLKMFLRKCQPKFESLQLPYIVRDRTITPVKIAPGQLPTRQLPPGQLPPGQLPPKFS